MPCEKKCCPAEEFLRHLFYVLITKAVAKEAQHECGHCMPGSHNDVFSMKLLTVGKGVS